VSRCRRVSASAFFLGVGLLTVSSCGAAPSSDDQVVTVTPQGGTPTQVTVPSNVAGRVTDVAARGITPEQLAVLQRACRDAEQFPRPGSDCSQVFQNMINGPTISCQQLCILILKMPEEPDLPLFQVRDSRSGVQGCNFGKALCDGVRIRDHRTSLTPPTSTKSPATKTSTPTPGKKTSPGSTTTTTGTPATRTPPTFTATRTTG
jgi:hypothetical protein